MNAPEETQKLPGEDAIDQIVNRIDALPSGYMQVQSGEFLGRIIFLNRSLTRLGLSADTCAVIAHRADGYYLSHLDGEAPPLLNGTSIGDRSMKLQDGDRIEVQGIAMKFHKGLPKDPIDRETTPKE
jgi:hypothetical protein